MEKWTINLTNIEAGLFRTMNGNADEIIAIGRVIKAGFPCSRVDVTNARYDAIVDLGIIKKLLRIQIKGTSNNNVSFIGGGRSGVQIDRNAPKKTYKYTKADCDLIIVINSNDGTCYIIPIEEITQMGNSSVLNKLEQYKENWQLLIDLAHRETE